MPHGIRTQVLACASREVHIQPQLVDTLVKKNKEIKNGAKENQTNHKRRNTKGCFHTTQEEQNDVETKGTSSEVHHHTTKNEQDGVEAKERAALCIYLSGMGAPSSKK